MNNKYIMFIMKSLNYFKFCEEEVTLITFHFSPTAMAA